jgi:hypothetical protein
MNANNRQVPTVFEPEIRFEMTPIPVLPLGVPLETRFDRLRAQLLLEHLQELENKGLSRQVRRAANEAAALAWVTPYPLLVFPALFEERTQRALACGEPQEDDPQPCSELASC